MSENKTYAEILNDIIGRYNESPDAGGLFSIICKLLEGIVKDCSLPCPVEMNLDELRIKPMFFGTTEGKEHLVVFTHPDIENRWTVADIRLRTLMRVIFNMDKCEGIVFNPFDEEDFFVPKELFMFAIGAGYKMAIEDEEDEADEEEEETIEFNSRNSVEVTRPISHADFEVIEERVKNLSCEKADDFAVIDLKDDKDELLFMQTIRHGELWYTELAFDMTDFGTKVPLILGAELEREETLDLFRKLLEEGISVDECEIVMNQFRDTGFTGMGDDDDDDDDEDDDEDDDDEDDDDDEEDDEEDEDDEDE